MMILMILMIMIACDCEQDMLFVRLSGLMHDFVA